MSAVTERLGEIADRAASVDAALAKIDDCEASDENYAITLVPHIVHSATEASALDVPALVAALRAVLALHQPQRPTSQWDLVSWDACSCGAMAVTTAIDGMRSIGPVAHTDCPTVRAITAALDAS